MTGRSATSSAPRVLLTGATGFVGSHVARVLVTAGCDVHALIRPSSPRDRIGDLLTDLTVIEGDLATASDPAVLEGICPDMCLHLAWYAEPGRYLHAVPENLASLRASLDLIEALAATGCRRVVVTGTCAEYGQAAPGEVFAEIAPLRPGTPYARAKAALLLAATDTAATAGMGLAWARLFFLYGPWEQEARVIPSAVLACLRNQVFPATAGEQVRDYLHVADAATGLWSVATSDLTGPVNVCSGQGVTLRSVLESVEGAAGSRGTVKYGAKAYLTGEWMWMQGHNAPLVGTGWSPEYTLDDGIADTVDWWRRAAMLQR